MSDARELHANGARLYREGNYPAALSALRRATLSIDAQPSWFALLGSSEARMGNRGAAADAVRRALEMKPGVATWERRLAIYLSGNGTWDEAEAILKRLVKGAESQASDFGLLAQIYFRQKKWSSAIPLLEKAVAADPQPRWLAMIAECRARMRPASRSDGSNDCLEHFYDELYRTNPKYASRPEETQHPEAWNWIADRIAKIAGTTILDLGCGPGQVAEIITARFPDKAYIGLDFSAEAIAMAKARCPDVRFVKADIVSEGSFENIAYDIVVSTEFLEHVEADLPILSRLRPRTPFFGSVPNFDSVSHVRFFRDSKEVADRYGRVLDQLEVEEVPLGGGNCLFLLAGRACGERGA